jgi:bacteriorhodopsin
MRWILNIIGIILGFMGTVWILQGTGVLPVGSMAHVMKWAYYGIALDIFAAALIVGANHRRKTRPSA